MANFEIKQNINSAWRDSCKIRIMNSFNKLNNNPSLLTKFFAAFNKYAGSFNTVIPQDTYDKSGNKTGTEYRVLEANRTGVINIIIDDWHEGLLASKYATIDNNGVVTISDSIKPAIDNINKLIAKHTNKYSEANSADTYTDLINSLSDIGITIDKNVFSWISRQNKPKNLFKAFKS